MHLVALILVILGLAALALAIHPAYVICAYSEFKNKGWLILLSLIVVFIISYFGYLCLLLSAAGSMDIVHFIVAAIFFAGGAFVLLVTYLSKQTIIDIDNLLQQKHHQANHDLLTSLANRQHFYSYIDSKLNQETEGFYCLMLDINDFKKINDSFGHNEGDNMLQVIAQRISHAVPANCLAARIGGDEFAVIIPKASDSSISHIAQAIEQSLSIDIECAGHTIVIGASIGISEYPKDGLDQQTLLKNADIAMYHAKKNAFSIQYYQSHLAPFNKRCHPL
ncbi:GGDEF domain-containing protein [Shewanella youngdeokensis]|uniref:GGDEF domain-containing protein n=1 Tax=Shewanella youngdeokensis TaxID=2999068 RepID=A0ABZ0JW52_9GAMM|nr:GGDEF domain-containing protein [Shewanella sp. DAU334]